MQTNIYVHNGREEEENPKLQRIIHIQEIINVLICDKFLRMRLISNTFRRELLADQ